MSNVWVMVGESGACPDGTTRKGKKGKSEYLRAEKKLGVLGQVLSFIDAGTP